MYQRLAWASSLLLEKILFLKDFFPAMSPAAAPYGGAQPLFAGVGF
jgi:hypothetical protein